MSLPPPSSTLFPYTTLFRSCLRRRRARACSGRRRNGEKASRVARPAHGRRRPSRRARQRGARSEEHTSELQSRLHLVCRLLLEKKKTQTTTNHRRSSV